MTDPIATGISLDLRCKLGAASERRLELARQDTKEAGVTGVELYLR